MRYRAISKAGWQRRRWPRCSSVAVGTLRPNLGPTGLAGLVCPCCCVRSAPVDGGGGRPLGGCAAAVLRFQPTYTLGHMMDLATWAQEHGAGAAAL
jgi:hypothetical protein